LSPESNADIKASADNTAEMAKALTAYFSSLRFH
jgi:hypothetical protein